MKNFTIDPWLIAFGRDYKKNKIKSSLLLLLFTCLLAPSHVFSQTQFLEPKLDYGPYDSGFKVFHEYDYSRTASIIVPESGNRTEASQPRPIQIGVWYPIKKGSNGNKMPFKKYIEIMATQTDFDYKGKPLEHSFIRNSLYENSFINKEQLELAIAATSSSFEDAPGADGNFPVLVYSAGGYGSTFENSTMFEYLASHGFIVASHSNIGGTGGNINNLNNAMFEYRARDLEFVIDFMHQFPNANLDKLGIFGFSFGGSACMISASRHLKVKAFANLDGWITNETLPFMHFADTTKLNIPYLTANSGFSGQKPDRLVYNNLGYEDAYALNFKKFGHTFFGSSWILLSNHDADDWTAVKGSQEEINLGYKILSEYVLTFFDGYLNNNQSSKDQLKSIHHSKEIPVGFIEFEMKTKRE